MADKCEHCGVEIKEHSYLWRTSKASAPDKPVEDGPEWGSVKLIGLLPGGGEQILGIMCVVCGGQGKKFQCEATK